MEKTVVGIELLDFGTTPMPELESGIIKLGSDIAAAEAVWLSMIAAFDLREGWAGHGVVSCAHWLSWRCGLALPAAHEKVRVARALTQLPATSASFEKGELSYSRARAITRVATPENETELVELARHTTGAQLERVVRAMSGVVKAEEVKERSFRRQVSWHWEEDGSLRLTARLDPVEGAAVINAIEAAQAADPKPAADAAVEGAEPARGPEDAERQDQVEAAEATEVTEPVEPLETMECPQGDAADAARESRVDAFVAIAESYIASSGQSTGADVYQVVVHLREDGTAHLDNGPAVPSETFLRISCDATFYCLHEDPDGNVMDVGRRTRAITPPLHRGLRQRDGSCRFPGCGRRRRLHAHHVRHWARGGRTMLVNLVYLCPRHHVLVHEGAFGVTMTAGQPVFTRPDGSVIPEGPAEISATNIPAQWHRADVLTTAVDTQWAGESLDLGYVVAGLVRDRSNEGPARVSRHHDGSEGTR
ncbi:HNH endonuclease signature motif containing protein [Acidothermaceae bacterium B102]|nr:HNH endonuclease signature motif containing protein [Acidothermaceae bacterium B102]